MPKNLYSAKEIADMKLAGLPHSKGKVISRAMSEGWYFEYRTGVGGKRRMYEIPVHYLGGTEDKAAEQPLNRQETTKPVVTGAIAGGQQVDLAILQQVEAVLEEVLQAKGVRLLPERRGAVVAFLYDYATKGAGVERLKAALQALVA